MELLWLVPTIPLIGSLILILTQGKLPELPAGIVGAGSIGLAFLVALIVGVDFLSGEQLAYTQNLWTWLSVGSFEAGFSLYLDGERAMLEDGNRIVFGPCASAVPLPSAPRERY